MALNEPWYDDLAKDFGEDFCRMAGYFDETKPWAGPYINHIGEMPVNNLKVIQFSGAFHPLHEGHIECIRNAIEVVKNPFGSNYRLQHLRNKPHLVLHLDHSEYRQSKGYCDEDTVRDRLKLLDTLDVPYTVVEEDKIPDGCSRNFTRLYRELVARGNQVFFLSGGDRANYALTFILNGYCVISGRDSSPMYQKYKELAHDSARIFFVPGNNKASSTEVRNAL